MSKKKKIIVMSSLVFLLALTAVLNVLLAQNRNAQGEVVTTANYFATYRSERTTTRSEELLQLDSIIELYDAESEEYAEAVAMKMDIVTANVIKGFVIFIATPFSLAVFMINGQVEYSYGLLHGLGNVIGAWLASHYFVGWGGRFIKIFTIVIVLVCFADLVGVLSLHDIFSSMLTACK